LAGVAVREGEQPEEERAEALAVVLRAQAPAVVPEPVAVRARVREQEPEKAPGQAPECQDRPPAIAIISVSSPIGPNASNASSARLPSIRCRMALI